MLDERYAEAVLHTRRPHVVLGLRLQPYSLWHSLLLEVYSSPIAGYQRQLDLAALHTAARICTLVWPQSIPRGLNRLGACFLQYRYGRFLAREQLRFRAYYEDYVSCPVAQIREEGASLNCPWQEVAVRRLRMDDSALSERDAWMMPFGQAIWRNAASRESRGEKVSLLTPERLAAYREAGYEV